MKRIFSGLVLTALLFPPVAAQADGWEPNVFADSFPVSVMVRHYSDALEVTGPTGLRAIVLTINGHARFKGDKAKITVETTTPSYTNVSRVYLFTVIGSGPPNVSFRIGDSDVQYDALFAQLKNATSVHAVVNNTDMRFDADGLAPDFDVYTHQE
ncbi:hypothetical protein [Pseudomonas sp. D3-10]|uniref:hypothetical protein n=1 Tax=Pseudomonas sp. D3-10 TaxID=2817392 RepID=UPI003DA80671